METLLTMRGLLITLICVVLPTSASGTEIGAVGDLGLVVTQLQNTITTLSNQLELQQLSAEERVRSEGSSGLKLVRGRPKAYAEPYYGNTYTGTSMGSIHDHSNNNQTCGMGEVIAVMNGVEFRTRHNDYKMVKPGGKDDDFHATETIEYPDVPPAVLGKQSVKDQIAEMREWFKAWKDQDTSVRDYRPYFKPNLCYMEGGWLVSDSNGLDEPFASDRHHIDAKTLEELMLKVEYTGYSGGKSRGENLAYLPRKIHGIDSNATVRFAQWSYRILCHPLKQDVPLKAFHLEDDKVPLKINKIERDEMLLRRSARFVLSVDETKEFSGAPSGKDSFLDRLMYEIPGKSGYLGSLTDDALGQAARTVDGDTLNSANYHRFYKMPTDAMGQATRKRGFSDDSLWVAFTDRPEVVPVKVPAFEGVRSEVLEHRVTYAIPLEIVFTTPLQKWNPYNLPYRGSHKSEEGKQAYADKRDGSAKRPYDGTTSSLYYNTPASFYTLDDGPTDSADTVIRTGVHVLNGRLDAAGNATYKQTMASGIHIVLPTIPTVGKLRLRFPVAPLHQESRAIWREHEVTKETLNRMVKLKESGSSHANVQRINDIASETERIATNALLMASLPTESVVIPAGEEVEFQTWFLLGGKDLPVDVEKHSHEVMLRTSDVEKMQANPGNVTVFVNTLPFGVFPNNHTHQLEVEGNINLNILKYSTCDGYKTKCKGDTHRSRNKFIPSHKRWNLYRRWRA